MHLAWDLKFQVCLRYTFTPATLNTTSKTNMEGYLSVYLSKMSMIFTLSLMLLTSCCISSIVKAGNSKGGSITVLLTSCLTGLESAV